jgi:saccharopine dehydrogenase (NADP+, L-glutamate forming)
MQKQLGASASDEETLVKAISAKTAFKDETQKKHIIGGLRWLGTFSDEQVRISNSYFGPPNYSTMARL